VPGRAVIPAAVAYVKFVAVKKLVVGFSPETWECRTLVLPDVHILGASSHSLTCCVKGVWEFFFGFYFEQSNLFKESRSA